MSNFLPKSFLRTRTESKLIFFSKNRDSESRRSAATVTHLRLRFFRKLGVAEKIFTPLSFFVFNKEFVHVGWHFAYRSVIIFLTAIRFQEKDNATFASFRRNRRRSWIFQETCIQRWQNNTLIHTRLLFPRYARLRIVSRARRRRACALGNRYLSDKRR